MAFLYLVQDHIRTAWPGPVQEHRVRAPGRGHNADAMSRTKLPHPARNRGNGEDFGVQEEVDLFHRLQCVQDSVVGGVQTVQVGGRSLKLDHAGHISQLLRVNRAASFAVIR